MSFIVHDGGILCSTPARKRRVRTQHASVAEESRSQHPESPGLFDTSSPIHHSDSPTPFSSTHAAAESRRRRYGRLVEVEFEHSLEALSIATSEFSLSRDDDDDDEPGADDSCASTPELSPDGLPAILISDATPLSPLALCARDSWDPEADAVFISAFPAPPGTPPVWNEQTLEEILAMGAYWRDAHGEGEGESACTPVLHAKFGDECEADVLWEAHMYEGRMGRLLDCLDTPTMGPSGSCDDIDEQMLVARSPLVLLEAGAKRRSAQVASERRPPLLSSHSAYAVLESGAPAARPGPPRTASLPSSSSTGAFFRESVAPQPSRKDLRRMFGSPFMPDEAKFSVSSRDGCEDDALMDESQEDERAELEPELQEPVSSSASESPRKALPWNSYSPHQSMAPFATYAPPLRALPPMPTPTTSLTPPMSGASASPSTSTIGSPYAACTPWLPADMDSQDPFLPTCFMEDVPEDVPQERRGAAARNLFKRAVGRTGIVARWKKL